MVDASEKWMPVPSVPGVMASSFGRVWSESYTRPMPSGGVREYTSSPRYGQDDTSSTRRAGSPMRKIIRIARLRKTFKVHQLVCEAFHGPKPSPKHIVLHLNEDPSDNRPVNLRWGTRKENQNFPKVKKAFRARVGGKSPQAIYEQRRRDDPDYRSRNQASNEACPMEDQP